MSATAKIDATHVNTVFSCHPMCSAVGDSVKEDEVLGEIETDKTSIPINSPSSGVIEALLVEDGTTVTPGMDILKLRQGPGGAASSTPKTEPKETAQTVTPQVKPTPATPQAPAPASSPPAPQKIVTASPPSQTPNESIFESSRGEQRVKMNRMRQRIAQRLKDAQNQYAMLTTFNEIDMT